MQMDHRPKERCEDVQCQAISHDTELRGLSDLRLSEQTSFTSGALYSEFLRARASHACSHLRKLTQVHPEEREEDILKLLDTRRAFLSDAEVEELVVVSTVLGAPTNKVV